MCPSIQGRFRADPRSSALPLPSEFGYILAIHCTCWYSPPIGAIQLALLAGATLRRAKLKKEHHYLPRLYLRQFAVDPRRRLVAMYNVGRSLFRSAVSIRDQGSLPFMYGRDGTVEDALMLLESETARAIARMIRFRRAPRQYSLDHQALAAFVVAQRRRTPRAARELIDSANLPLAIAYRDDPRYAGIGEDVLIAPETPPAVAVGWSLWLWPLLLDLTPRLLWTTRTPGFITSDNPVIYYNQLLETRRPHLSNTGLLTRGLQVIVPISPNATLMLYDQTAYRVGSRCRATVLVTHQRDVDEINSLQAASADLNLYFSSGVDVSYLRNLLERSKPARDSYHVQASAYRGTSNRDEGMIHVRAPEIRLALKLPFVKIRRAADKDVDYTSVIAPRDRRTWDLAQAFGKLTQDGKAQQQDFYYFLAADGKMRRTPDSYRGHNDASEGRSSNPRGESSERKGRED